MANMYISEYAAINFIQLPTEPPVTTPQKVVFTTSTPSEAFNSNTKFICVQLDADGHISVGTSPTAATSSRRLIAGQDYYFEITAGHKIAAVTAV